MWYLIFLVHTNDWHPKKSSLSFPHVMQWTTLIDTRCKEEWVTADTTVMNAVALAEQRWGASREAGGFQNACGGIMVQYQSSLPDTGEAKSWSKRWTRSRVLTGHANKNCREWEFKAVLSVKCLVSASKEQVWFWGFFLFLFFSSPSAPLFSSGCQPVFKGFSLKKSGNSMSWETVTHL